MHSLRNDNIKVFIQALHDAESLDHLHNYVQQKIITRTLRAALTLTQKLAEMAKLRVHDSPPKDNLQTTSSPQRSQHWYPERRVVGRQRCPHSSPKLPVALPERQVQLVVRWPATPPPGAMACHTSTSISKLATWFCISATFCTKAKCWASV
jgi:hypothetical protein